MNAQQLETLIRQVQSRVDCRSNYITRLEAEYSYEIPAGNSPKLREMPKSVANTLSFQREEQTLDKRTLKAMYSLQKYYRKFGEPQELPIQARMRRAEGG